MNFKELYNSDVIRSGGMTRWENKFHYYLRRASTTSSRLLLLFYRWRYKHIREKHGIEISYITNIGKGFYIGHPYNITINPNAVIGNNCSVHKGVVIGEELRGTRKGSPILGDCVWVGINAAIVGNVRIGNDVLIAPNSYINFDVPDHSIVIGNPGIVMPKENATEGYINNRVEV